MPSRSFEARQTFTIPIVGTVVTWYAEQDRKSNQAYLYFTFNPAMQLNAASRVELQSAGILSKTFRAKVNDVDTTGNVTDTPQPKPQPMPIDPALPKTPEPVIVMPDPKAFAWASLLYGILIVTGLGFLWASFDRIEKILDNPFTLGVVYGVLGLILFFVFRYARKFAK